MTGNKIRAKYKVLHDTLSEAYYGGTSGLSKEKFDTLHGQVWKNMEDELISEGHLTIPEPPRDLVAEIDDLTAKIKVLESR